MTSDIWLKPSLNTLVYRGGGVNSSNYRCMEVGTETNSCRSFLGGVISMERPYGSVDENILGSEGL